MSDKADHPLPVAPPPGMNYIALIKPSLLSVIIGQTFIVLLVALLIALFSYSTPHSRRQPIFILNILALVVGLTTCITAHVLMIHMLLLPQSMQLAQAQLVIANILLGAFQEMLADTILLVRLIAVYPLSRVGPVRFALLMSLPITLKVARVVNLILFTIRLSSMANGPNAFVRIAESGWLTGPNMKIEWVVQVVDNSYASIAFLWTLRAFSTDTTTSDSFLSIASFRQSSFSERVRILFHLALSNYLIPTVMSIVQLAFVFRFGDTDACMMSSIAYVNSMVSVSGVAFATVWAGKEHRQEEKNVSPGHLPVEREQQCACGLDKWRARLHAPATDTANIRSPESEKTSLNE